MLTFYAVLENAALSRKTTLQCQFFPIDLKFWFSSLYSSIQNYSGRVLKTTSAWPWRRRWHPTPVLLPGKSHGRRSLVGCSPWGREESDTTERLHFHFSLSCIGEGHGNPLQCSCLENLRDGGAWWAAVYGVAQSQTRLKRLSSSSIVNKVVVVVQSLSCLLLCKPVDCSTLGPRIFLYFPVCSNPCLESMMLSISSSAASFSFCLQSLRASGSFPMNWLFAISGYP